MQGGIKITYELRDIGRASKPLSGDNMIMDVTNYSFEGDVCFESNEAKMVIAQVPLLEAFYAIYEILKIVPTFADRAQYAQMFRDAQTFISVDGNEIVAEHREIAALRAGSGASLIKGGYVCFCREFGKAAKGFIKQIEGVSPWLFESDEFHRKFKGLMVGARIDSADLGAYPIV